MINGIIGRVRRLEQLLPNPAEGAALRRRIEEAEARVEAMLTPEERALRQSPEYLAEQAEWQSRHDARMDAILATGRKPTLAETILSAQERLR